MSDDVNSWLIVATIAGPILAVQAQKWVDLSRAKARTQDEIFRTLFATRDKRLLFEHVRALNSIDLAYRHRVLFGLQLPNKRLEAILAAWQRYLDELSTPPVDQSPVAIAASNNARADRFFDLLGLMGSYLGYDIDDRVMRQRLYVPTGHTRMEDEIRALREGMMQVLDGSRAITIQIRQAPQQHGDDMQVVPVFRDPRR